MWPKLQNIGEKWFILSFDLRVFIEKGTILIKKRHCLTAMYQFALLAKKDTATKRCLLWGARTDSSRGHSEPQSITRIYLFFHVFSAKLPQMCYERIIDQYLSEWATRATHKPVLLRGARQDSESVIILNLQFLADIEIIMKAIVIFIDDTHTTIG